MALTRDITRSAAVPIALSALLAMGATALAQPASRPAQSAPATQPDRRADPLAEASLRLAQIERMVGIAPAEAATVGDRLDDLLAMLDTLDREAGVEWENVRPGPGAAQRGVSPAALVAQRTQLRTLRCRIALLRGEAYRSAAAAVGRESQQAQPWVEAAIQAYRSLRVEYKELPLALLGYVGEARVQRLRNDADAARAALAPLLELARTRRANLDAALVRVARLEQLELALLDNPRQAAVESGQLKATPDFREPPWPARLDWVAARAMALQALAPEGGDRADASALLQQAAALIRDAQVRAAVPAHERLQLLVRLDEAANRTLMARDELLEWAGLLAPVSPENALAWFARARQASEVLAPRQVLTVAALHWKQNAYEAAVRECDELLRRSDLPEPDRLAASRLRGLSLAALHRDAEGTARDQLRPKVLVALKNIFDSNAPDETRRDALRQWVSIQSDAPARTWLPALEAHADLIAGDPYLSYARAAARWELLQSRAATTAPAAELEQQARAILADAVAAEDAAPQSEASGLTARAALLRAKVTSSPPLDEKRSALEILADREQLLAGSPVASEASQLRISLLLGLGLLDAAEAAVSTQPAPGQPERADVLLQLAQALTSRYAASDKAARATLQQRVSGLTQRALASSVHDARAYPAVARQAARALLQVRAGADAAVILGELIKSEAVKADRDALIDCTLMLAEALDQQGKSREAEALYDQLATAHPQRPEVMMARGAFELSAGRPARAVDCFRRARTLRSAGTQGWCEATLALVESFLQNNEARSAADVLRVTLALYPACTSGELHDRVRSLERRIESARTATR